MSGTEVSREERIRTLIEQLQSLTTGEQACATLALQGAAAVGPLRRFLLNGKLESIYQPRRWAVEALGALGATGVLMEYLATERETADAVLRQGELVVQNAAVAELANRADETILGFLTALSANKRLPALMEALGRHKVIEAIPILDRALEDDVCRAAAKAAFVVMGPAARTHLLLSAKTRLPSDGGETPSSVLRRRTALSVLQEIGINARQDWPQLSGLLDDEDTEIVVATCKIALDSGAAVNIPHAVEALLRIAPAAPWFLHRDLIECLQEWWPVAQPFVLAEIERRRKTFLTRRAPDPLLELLLRVPPKFSTQEK